MRKVKIVAVWLMFVSFMIIGITTSNAASLSIKAAKSTANKNDSVKITVTGSEISGRVELSANGGTISPNSVWVDNSSVSATVKITGNSDVKITAKTIDTADSTNGETFSDNKSTTIKVKTSSENNTSTTNNSKSSDATLSNLGISPNDFKGFSKDTTTYNVNVPKSVEKISIYATATDKKATVAGTGAKSLNVGKNTFNIKVTAEDKKTTKTYTLNITRSSGENSNNNATLSNLGIRPKEYDFTGFKPGVTDYKVEVPNKVEKVTIYASKSDSEATIDGIGEKKLKVGENKFAIKVTAEDKKTTKTYNLTISRKEESDDEDNSAEDKTTTSITGVKNIKIEDYELTPEFKPETYEYKINLPSDKESVKVDVETEDNIEAEIVGNEELKVGENIITVLVRDTKTDATTTYQIIANVSENKKNVSVTEIESIDSPQTNSEINQLQNNYNKRDLIIIGVIVLIVILIIIYLIKRYKSRRDEFYYNNEYEEQGNETKENDISETKNFYNQMKNENIFKEDIEKTTNVENYDEYEKPKRTGRYKGKRFK